MAFAAHGERKVGDLFRIEVRVSRLSASAGERRAEREAVSSESKSRYSPKFPALH